MFTPMHTREKQKISLLRLTARLLKDVCLCLVCQGGGGRVWGEIGVERHMNRGVDAF